MSKNFICRFGWYHYRRRIPARLGGGYLQIPMMTDKHPDARRLALILSVEQDRAFGSGMSPTDVRKALHEIAVREASLARLGIASVPSHAEPRAPLLPPAPPGFDPSVSAVVDRLLKRKAEDGVGIAQATQIRAVMRVFVAATEETDVRAVTQGHLAKFRETMSQLPKSHGKSERTRGLSLTQIIEDAKALPAAKRGLAAATINRNLEIVRQVLRAAAAEGITVTPGIDPARLRRKETIRQRDKREPFSIEDCRAIFSSPIWTGSRSAVRRRFPGSEIIRDGLYWIPLIAAYTGARREEIAGLEIEDLDFVSGSWVFRLRPNTIRPSLKTASSTRIIPAHPDLVRLGFFSWADGVRRSSTGAQTGDSGKENPGKQVGGDTGQGCPLFSELKRKSRNAGLGEQIAFIFDKVLDDVLGPNRGPKSFHSFRHFTTDSLRRAGVAKEIRLDILGHSGEDLEDEVYGSSSRIEDMQAAINLLPSVVPPNML